MAKCTRVFFLCFLVFAVFSLSGCSSGGGSSSSVPKNNVPASIEADAQALIADLTAQGFEVTRGYFKLYTEDDCQYSYAVMKSCYGNNPAAPYVMFAVLPWKNEFVDPATINAWGLVAEGYSATFRVDPREAIVILGQMPPQAAYFGLQTYQFTREGTFDTTSSTYQYIKNTFPAMLSSFFTVVPKNPNRIQLFASLSNSNNNVVIERQSGASFNQERFFVITPDKFMNSAVRQALGKQAVSSANIFTEPVPSTMKTGLNDQADDFVFMMRYAMPQDGGGPGTPSDTWRQDLPLVVLRVRDVSPARAAQPYGPVVLEARTAVDESLLTSDLTNLVSAINNDWGQPCTKTDCSDRASSFIDLQSSAINFVGPDCTMIGMNCMGDTQDTSYHSTANLTLDNGEIYAVAATLGTETGNAAYVGLSVNESLMVKGLQNINSNQLKNTAQAYAGSMNNSGKFYVYYFTRNCAGLEALTGGNCFSITEEMIPACTSPTTQPCDYLKIVQRRYIKPGTQRGPQGDPTTHLLAPSLIKLKRK